VPRSISRSAVDVFESFLLGSLDDGIANELFTADARFNKIFQFLIRVVINPLQVHPVGGTKTIQSD
jgi:hypothetical protein